MPVMGAHSVFYRKLKSGIAMVVRLIDPVNEGRSRTILPGRINTVASGTIRFKRYSSRFRFGRKPGNCNRGKSRTSLPGCHLYRMRIRLPRRACPNIFIDNHKYSEAKNPNNYVFWVHNSLLSKDLF